MRCNYIYEHCQTLCLERKKAHDPTRKFRNHKGAGGSVYIFFVLTLP